MKDLMAEALLDGHRWRLYRMVHSDRYVLEGPGSPFEFGHLDAMASGIRLPAEAHILLRAAALRSSPLGGDND